MSVQTKITVSKDKYIEILGFTTYAYLTGKITSYSGIMGGKRALGEYIENFIYGKIAEVALQQFLKENFNLEVLTDLDLPDFILGMYLPDLIAVKKGNDYESLKFWVEIKEVRRDQKWLLVTASSIKARPYDAYVAVKIGLPDTHIAWLMKEHPEISSRMGSDWIEKLEDVKNKVTNIDCEILGFVMWEDVKKVVEAEGNPVIKASLDSKFGVRGWHHFKENEPLFDPDNPVKKGSRIRENIGFALTRLKETSDWSEFINYILDNSKKIDRVSLKGRNRRGLPDECKHFFGAINDYRDVFQKCIDIQLDRMKHLYGDLKRTKSWFSSPLE